MTRSFIEIFRSYSNRPILVNVMIFLYLAFSSITNMVLMAVFMVNLYGIMKDFFRERERERERERVFSPRVREIRNEMNNPNPITIENLRNIGDLLNRNVFPVLRRNGIQIRLPEDAASENMNENRGLSEEEIERFPTRIANRNMDSKCSICLNKIKKGDLLRRLPCLHEFHPDCIDRWLRENNSCPIDKFCCN